MKTWQQMADEHTAHLTDEQLADPQIRNLVRTAADIEMAEQAGDATWAERLEAYYDRIVARLGYDPLT